MHCHVEVNIAFNDLTLCVRSWRGNTGKENAELFSTLTDVPFVTNIMLLYQSLCVHYIVFLCFEKVDMQST
jgi:hypothetical protein